MSEIRKVPANWKHPINRYGNYEPFFSMEDLNEALLDFHTTRDEEFPNLRYYMPAGDWFQLFEKVSEGTPITPPFKTLEELGDYLVNHGDWYDEEKWERKEVEGLIKCFKNGYTNNN